MAKRCRERIDATTDPEELQKVLDELNKNIATASKAIEEDRQLAQSAVTTKEANKLRLGAEKIETRLKNLEAKIASKLAEIHDEVDIDKLLSTSPDEEKQNAEDAEVLKLLGITPETGTQSEIPIKFEADGDTLANSLVKRFSITCSKDGILKSDNSEFYLFDVWTSTNGTKNKIKSDFTITELAPVTYDADGPFVLVRFNNKKNNFPFSLFFTINKETGELSYYGLSDNRKSEDVFVPVEVESSPTIPWHWWEVSNDPGKLHNDTANKFTTDVGAKLKEEDKNYRVTDPDVRLAIMDGETFRLDWNAEIVEVSSPNGADWMFEQQSTLLSGTARTDSAAQAAAFGKAQGVNQPKVNKMLASGWKQVGKPVVRFAKSTTEKNEWWCIVANFFTKSKQEAGNISTEKLKKLGERSIESTARLAESVVEQANTRLTELQVQSNIEAAQTTLDASRVFLQEFISIYQKADSLKLGWKEGFNGWRKASIAGLGKKCENLTSEFVKLKIAIDSKKTTPEQSDELERILENAGILKGTLEQLLIEAKLQLEKDQHTAPQSERSTSKINPIDSNAQKALSAKHISVKENELLVGKGANAKSFPFNFPPNTASIKISYTKESNIIYVDALDSAENKISLKMFDINNQQWLAEAQSSQPITEAASQELSPHSISRFLTWYVNPLVTRCSFDLNMRDDFLGYFEQVVFKFRGSYLSAQERQEAYAFFKKTSVSDPTSKKQKVTEYLKKTLEQSEPKGTGIRKGEVAIPPVQLANMQTEDGGSIIIGDYYPASGKTVGTIDGAPLIFHDATYELKQKQIRCEWNGKSVVMFLKGDVDQGYLRLFTEVPSLADGRQPLKEGFSLQINYDARENQGKIAEFKWVPK